MHIAQLRGARFATDCTLLEGDNDDPYGIAWDALEDVTKWFGFEDSPNYLEHLAAQLLDRIRQKLGAVAALKSKATSFCE